MSRSITPDFAQLSVPQDQWSAPFWSATAKHRLIMPKCQSCGTFRWPASPFCGDCQAQGLEWLDAGQARVYSYSVLPMPEADKDAPPKSRIPVLAEFTKAPGVRLVSVLIDADPSNVTIGALLEPVWLPAADATIAAFRLADD